MSNRIDLRDLDQETRRQMLFEILKLETKVLTELDENEANPDVLWVEIIRLRVEVMGPKGFDTWKDAAIDERIMRVNGEKRLNKLRALLENEIDHAHLNELKLAPIFGRIDGEYAIRADSIQACLDNPDTRLNVVLGNVCSCAAPNGTPHAEDCPITHAARAAFAVSGENAWGGVTTGVTALVAKIPDVSFAGGNAPTHYCKVCGAMWLRHEDGWNLRSKECGPCCDNVAMGEQIVRMDQYKGKLLPTTDETRIIQLMKDVGMAQSWSLAEAFRQLAKEVRLEYHTAWGEPTQKTIDLVDQYVINWENGAKFKRQLDEVYYERNQLVAALAKLFPSGIDHPPVAGTEPEWHNCVLIDLPTGQVSWHYHGREAHLFDGLARYEKPWDGHDTAEKYRRLNALTLGAIGQEFVTGEFANTIDKSVSAFQKLKKALQADEGYAWSWHCNFAMPIMDSTKCTPIQANKAGADLMKYIFDIDVRKFSVWHHVGEETASTEDTKADTSNDTISLSAALDQISRLTNDKIYSDLDRGYNKAIHHVIERLKALKSS